MGKLGTLPLMSLRVAFGKASSSPSAASILSSPCRVCVNTLQV